MRAEKPQVRPQVAKLGLEQLRARLGEALFSTQGGKPRRAAEILVSTSFTELVRSLDRKRYHDPQDELDRSVFAPDNYRLGSEYAVDGHVLELFLFARQRRSAADAPQLAMWARDAAGVRRPGVIAYLVHGELATSVFQELANIGGLPWCTSDAELREHAKDLQLSDRELDVLRIRLFGFVAAGASEQFGNGDVDDEDQEFGGINLPVVVDAGAELARVASWWRSRGAHWASRYDARIYSGIGGSQQLASALQSQNQADLRDAWLLLLTLAACQRFGRQTDDQHGGFIRRLRQEGSPSWWSIVRGSPKKTKPDAWMRIIDQWLDSKVDDDSYRVWLALFPTLYQFHRHCDVYRDLLSRAHEHPADSFSLDLLLSPRANSALGGAGRGMEAPPGGPALGIGTTWALRELLRLSIVPRRPHLVRHCFVPRLPTRRFLAHLGAPDMGDGFVGTHGERSRRIHSFLESTIGAEEAEFGGAFDLPLYLVATDAEARRECGIRVVGE